MPPPSWEGEKLFPPAKRTSKSSRAWKFGGFRKDRSGVLRMEKTICSLCGKEIKYRNTPTNLTQHLQHDHDKEFSGGNGSASVTINSYFPQKANPKTVKYKTDNPKQKLVRSKLTEWVIDSNRPLMAVEDSKLVEAFEVADPKIKMPSRWQVKKDIIDLHKRNKEKTIKEFSRIEYFTCTSDAGSSSGAKSFIDVNVHFVIEDFILKKKVLDVFEIKEAKTAANYRKKVDEKLQEFDIKEKVWLHTTDNEATMRAAFDDNERNGFFAHIESIACKKALNNQKTLKMMRLKLRKIAKKANKSCNFKYAVEKQQRLKGLKVRTLKQEVKTRFTATHTMVRSILNDPNEKKDEEMDMEKVRLNIEAINQAMIDSKFKKEELTKLTIKEDDVRKMKELVNILDVLEVGITLIGGEKFATGSAVLPFLNKFLKLLEDDETDSVYISSFKRSLKTELESRCEVNLNKKVLAKILSIEII